MQCVCQYLQAVYQSGTWTAKVGVAISYVDAIVLNGGQASPMRGFTDFLNVFKCTVDAETAASDEQDFRPTICNLVPTQC